MLAECGALADLIDAGARILECACGPCIGMASPRSPAAFPCAPSSATSRRAVGQRTRGSISSRQNRCRIRACRRDDGPAHARESAGNPYPHAFSHKRQSHRKAGIPAEAADIVVERGPNIQPIPVGKAPEKDLPASSSSRWETTSQPTISCRPGPNPTLPFQCAEALRVLLHGV